MNVKQKKARLKGLKDEQTKLKDGWKVELLARERLNRERIAREKKEAARVAALKDIPASHYEPW
jgi:hypothetical protein